MRIAFRRQLGDTAENDGQYQHGQQRPNECPQHPDYGLLITHRQIASSEHSKQLAIAPEVEPIVTLSFTHFYDDRVVHLP
jgi:hypothetical protein